MKKRSNIVRNLKNNWREMNTGIGIHVDNVISNSNENLVYITFDKMISFDGVIMDHWSSVSYNNIIGKKDLPYHIMMKVINKARKNEISKRPVFIQIACRQDKEEAYDIAGLFPEIEEEIKNRNIAVTESLLEKVEKAKEHIKKYEEEKELVNDLIGVYEKHNKEKEVEELRKRIQNIENSIYFWNSEIKEKSQELAKIS